MKLEEITYYISEISKYEFADRDIEMQKISTKIKQEMNARGSTNSSITIGKLTEFISAEFTTRAEYVRDLTISSITKLDNKNHDDIITKTKNFYQKVVMAERDKLISFYKNTSHNICSSLKGAMHTQLESLMDSATERALRKNNLIIEFEYSAFTRKKTNKPIIQLKPGWGGCSIDVISLWKRYFKN